MSEKNWNVEFLSEKQTLFYVLSPTRSSGNYFVFVHILGKAAVEPKGKSLNRTLSFQADSSFAALKNQEERTLVSQIH